MKHMKLVIAGAVAVLALVIGLLAYNASQPERKTCEEWIATATTDPEFESNIGPACLFGGADPNKEYTLEELEEISENMADPFEQEGGILGELPEHEWQD